MKLKFNKHGLQFFFLTFAVEGRCEALSKVVIAERKGRREADVELSDYGEAIINLWKIQHRRNAALTASARVVMPDHAHFLLIVNYDRDPSFDILNWLHHFRREIEEEWQALASRQPTLPEGRPSVLPEGRQPALPEGRPSVLPEGRGGSAPVLRPPPRWEAAFWLDLSFDSRQLAAIRHYIRLNPARYLWKRNHPDCFVRHRGVVARALDPSRTWDAVGDLTLLGSPLLFHVRLTLKKTIAEHEAAIVEIVEKARRGMIPVSGFISPGEKEALHRLKAEPRARFIKMLPYGLPPRYDPSAEDSRELAARRLLILSGFPQTKKNDSSVFRRNCLEMNDLAAELCKRASTCA